MGRAYYSEPILKFLNEDKNLILGKLVKEHQFSLEEQQRNAWLGQIEILKLTIRM